LVGERLCRSHRDGVARVYAHWIQVFDGAYDNAVVDAVAYDFHLELFPAAQRVFDEQFFGGGCFQTPTADRFEFFTVVGNATATSAQGEAGPNHDWEASAACLGSDVALYRPG